MLIVRSGFRKVPILTIREGGTVPDGVLSPFLLKYNGALSSCGRPVHEENNLTKNKVNHCVHITDETNARYGWSGLSRITFV